MSTVFVLLTILPTRFFLICAMNTVSMLLTRLTLKLTVVKLKITNRVLALTILLGNLAIGIEFTECIRGIKTTQASLCGHSATRLTDIKTRTIAITN